MDEFIPIAVQVIGGIVLMVLGGDRWQSIRIKHRDTKTGIVLESVEAAVTETYHSIVKQWKAEGKGLTVQQANSARVRAREKTREYAGRAGVDIDKVVPEARVTALIEQFVTAAKEGAEYKKTDSPPGGRP